MKKVVSGVMLMLIILTNILTLVFKIQPVKADADMSGVEAWNFTTPLPEGRRYHASIEYNGYLYVVGGLGGNPTTIWYALINDNGEIRSWKSTTPLPSTRASLTLVEYNGYLYVIGGWAPYGPTYADIWYAPIYENGEVGAWSSISLLPRGTAGHTSAVYNGYLYVIGGSYRYQYYPNEFYDYVLFAPIYPNGTIGPWKHTTPLPATRSFHTSVVYNGYLYVIGGVNSSGISTDVWFAKINSDGSLGRWMSTTPLPVPKTDHTSVLHDNCIYVIGGGRDMDTVWFASVYPDGTIGNWKQTYSLLKGRASHTSVSFRDFVYAIGGYNYWEDIYYEDVEYARFARAPIQTWSFETDFQYNLDDNYGTVEGTGHLKGTATLSAGILSIEGQITLNGPLPATVPEVYLIATDGPDKELAKQAVDLSGFSYWQTVPNTYNFTGQIPNVIQPINNGHYEVSALITYNTGKYEFFVNTNSRISTHYLPLILLPPKFKVGDWVQTTANLNVREGAGLSYAIISTMPTGTLGRIVDGPLNGDGYVWWKVHYFMDYVSVVEGWSAENWLELYPLPICSVKLQSDGIEINKINVGEFFDICVGDSSSDKPIKAVRFSSDDIQDGIPTGEWTDWYEWEISSGDWNAIAKIKRWAFATPGYKEVWAEVRDETDHAAAGFAKIFVPAPALPTLTSPLVITPTKNIYNVGDALEAEFTIENVGDKPITLDKLLVGGRFNGGKLPNGEFPDFTFQTSITLQPGESYQYQGSLTLTQTGNYHFFVAYYIENPTPEEKRLLDENNWNTNIELGEGLNHKDRVKDIVVLEEVDLLKLEEAINRWEKVLTTYQYPPNLLDDKSFTGRVSKVWASFTSFITRTQLTEKYKELYSTGVEYHRLSYQALMDAKNCLEKGDVEGAGKYLQRSYTYGRLSGMSFSSAAEVYEASLEAGEILARGIKNACEAAVKVGVSVLYPPAATKVDLIYSAFDFVIDTKIEGLGETTKNLLEEKMIEFILKEWVFTSFDHNTFEDYANLVRANVPLDEILTNEEFLEELGYEQLYNALKYKLLTEAGIEFTLGIFETIHEDVVNYLKFLANSIQLKGGSPVELRVINQEGRITGIVNGTVKHEIPMSFYYNGTITIYFLADSYFYEVAGIEEGSYSLEITFTKEGTPTTFEATSIPTSQGVLHQYIVNWDALSLGEKGVTVQVDSDGDGVFEHTFTSDGELTHEEFVLQTETTIDFDPDALNLKSKGEWVTAYIEFPEGYDVGDINVSTILLNGSVPVDPSAPTAIGDYDNDGIPDLMVKFDRTQVAEYILSKGIMTGNVTLTITGQVNNGTPFQASDTIGIILPMPKHGRLTQFS
jgi:hypothetical protein